MAQQECPNCFLRIIPSADGTCPACQCNLVEAAGRHQGQSAMWLAQGKLLPKLCCTCARSTDHTILLKENEYGESNGGEDSAVVWMIKAAGFVVITLFMGIVGIFIWQSDEDRESRRFNRKVEGRIPQCPDCQRECEIPIRDSDFQRGAIKIVVHDHFAGEYRRLNS